MMPRYAVAWTVAVVEEGRRVRPQVATYDRAEAVELVRVMEHDMPGIAVVVIRWRVWCGRVVGEA